MNDRARPTPTPDPAAAVRPLVLAMVVGGLVTIGVGIILGATVAPALYAVCLIALVDFAIAWAYATGRVGPPRGRAEDEARGDLAAEVEADPLYNPYARED